MGDRSSRSNRRTRILYGTAGAASLLAVWMIAARLTGSELIVPGPGTVLLALAAKLADTTFWRAVAETSVRVFGGFGVSLVLGLLLGAASGISRRFEAALRPGLTLIQSTPVLAVILILLIWFGSRLVPVVTAVLMTLPVMTAAVAQGVRGADRQLTEMADVYSVPFGRRLRAIYIPSFLPGLFAGASASLGLTWKVVIAAEVLAQPVHGMGTAMQRAKTILETGEVFAWTIAAVVLCGLTQAVFSALARHWRTYGRKR